MEYYILKLYQNEKRKNADLEWGVDRFGPRIKKLVIGCLVMMIVAYVEVVVTVFLLPTSIWPFIGAILLVLSLVTILIVDAKDQKKHMEKYVNSHKAKIEILEKILENEFAINSREKMEELISIYQDYVNKKQEEEKKRNRIIITILSALAGVLTISFENMGLIGINFSSWVYFAVFVLLFVGIASIWIYSYTLFDSLKKKYEMMIKDLKELLLLKY